MRRKPHAMTLMDGTQDRLRLARAGPYGDGGTSQTSMVLLSFLGMMNLLSPPSPYGPRQKGVQMFRDLPVGLSIAEVAQIINGNKENVRRMCANGTIPAVKVGNKWVIARDLLFGKFIEQEEAWINKAS